MPEIDRVYVSKTAISEDPGEASIETALAAATRFGLKPAEAMTILAEVFDAVSRWHFVGRKLKITAGTLDAYASAFEQPLMDEAKRLLGK